MDENLYWDELVETLRAGLALNDTDVHILRYVLDKEFTGIVSKKTYQEFITCYDSIENCLLKLKLAFVRDYFYGYMTSKEAEVLLCRQNIGTFLLRLSKSSLGSFALSFVYAPNQVGHVLVSTTPDGFTLADAQQATLFPSIEDVIDYYKEGLHTPFHSTLPLQSYWLGDVSSSETSLLLSGVPPGTFLLRLSSQWGYLAASFMDSDGRVKHTLIEQAEGSGYRLPGETKFFPGMDDIIHYYSAALQIPLKRRQDFTFGELKQRVLEEYLQEIEEKKVAIAIAEESDSGALVSDAELERVASEQYLPGLNYGSTDLDDNNNNNKQEEEVPTVYSTQSENPQEAFVNAYATGEEYSSNNLYTSEPEPITTTTTTTATTLESDDQQSNNERYDEHVNAYVMAEDVKPEVVKEEPKTEPQPIAEPMPTIVVPLANSQEKATFLVSNVPDEPEVEELPKPDPIAKNAIPVSASHTPFGSPKKEKTEHALPFGQVKQGLRKVVPAQQPKPVAAAQTKPQVKPNSVKDLISIWEKVQFKD